MRRGLLCVWEAGCRVSPLGEGLAEVSEAPKSFGCWARAGCRVSWLGPGGSLMGEGGCRVSCLGVGGSLAWEAGCRVSCLGMGRLSGVLGGEGGV